MTEAVMIVIAAIGIFVITLLVKGIRIVPEQSAVMIERLGKFRTQLDPGLNIIIPVVDKPRSVPWRSTVKDGGQKFYVVSNISNLDLREQVYDFPSQSVITRDNVGIQVDAVVYFQITNPQKAVYEISNLPMALETLTQTTLRNVIGEMDLDDTLTSRETINASLVETIDSAAQAWGVKVNRVEVQDIMPPQDVQAAMEQQMKQFIQEFAVRQQEEAQAMRTAIVEQTAAMRRDLEERSHRAVVERGVGKPQMFYGKKFLNRTS